MAQYGADFLVDLSSFSDQNSSTLTLQNSMTLYYLLWDYQNISSDLQYKIRFKNNVKMIIWFSYFLLHCVRKVLRNAIDCFFMTFHNLLMYELLLNLNLSVQLLTMIKW